MRPLRIFLCCQQDLGGAPHPVPAYRFWREYFVNALTESGHTVLEAAGCDWAAGLLPQSPDANSAWRSRTWDQAIAFLRREHARKPVDLFLSYLYPGQILPAGLQAIRSLGVPSVNFFCDNVREFRRIPSEYAGFDLHWVPEAKALPLYRRAALPYLHAPMACWIPPDLRVGITNEISGTVFLGTRDELRAELFAKAFTLGLKATLHGPGWQSVAPSAVPPPAPTSRFLANQIEFVRHHGMHAFLSKFRDKLHPRPPLTYDFAPFAGPALFGAAYWNATRQASVCIGVNRYPSPRHLLDQPDTYSRLRDIEAPMAGACYLTEWTEGLDELYAPGLEIETYRNADELVEKNRMLIADPARRAALRTAGQRRALADHGIPNTIARIADRLGLA